MQEPPNIFSSIRIFLSDTNNFFLFVLLLTPLIYIEPLFNHVDLPRASFIEIISCLWLITWLNQANKNKQPINWTPLFFFILLLLLFSALSYFWGKQNTLFQTEIYLYTSLTILSFLSMQINPKSIQTYGLLLGAVASIVALIGILQNFNFNPFNYDQIAPPASTFMNKNFSANFFDLVLPVSLSVFFISRNKKEAWFSAISVATIISYILITKSRGAYLSTLIIFFAFFVSIHLFPFIKKQTELVSHKYKAQIIFIILLPILLFSLPSQVFQSDHEENRYQSFFSGDQGNSISVRFNAYQNSIDLIKEHPIIGVGLGGFNLHFKPYTQSTLAKNKIFSEFIYLHNDPLQLLVELGVIGFSSLFLFLFLLFYLGAKRLISVSNKTTSLNEKSQNILYLGFYIALTASLFHSLVSFPLHQASSALLFSLWVGILLGALSKKTVIFNKNNKGNKAPLLLTLLGSLFLIALSSFYYTYFKSSYYMHKASRAFELGQCDKAVSWSIISNNLYGKSFFAQDQGVIIMSGCSKDIKEQLAFAENVLKYNPVHPNALFLAGMSYYHLGNYDLSKKVLKAISFLYPNFTGSYTFLGHIALKQKQFKEAKFLFKQAFILAPKNETAKYFLNQLENAGY